MAWTYSGDPLASVLDEVRFLLGDTDSTKSWSLQNEEINYTIALHSSSPPVIGGNFLAAAVCAESIVGKLNQTVSSKSVGDLSISYRDPVQYYQALARNLRQRATVSGVIPFVGGASKAEKAAFAANSDQVTTAFKIDDMNNPRTPANDEDYPR